MPPDACGVPPEAPGACVAILAVFTHAAAPTFGPSTHAPDPMRAYVRRRLDMLHRTLAHFDAHPKAWNTAPALVRNVQTVRGAAATIEAAAEGQDAGNATGLTQDKTDARDHAEGLLGALGEAVGAYAIESGDDDFRAATDLPRSEWDRMSDADFFSQSAVTLARIEAALPDLAEYEVTGTDVSEAREAVEAARPLGATRDTRAAGRTVATGTLGATYSAAVPALEVLDRLVPRLVKDAAFVAEYRVVRRLAEG